jgi:hypothetical protein
MTIFFFKNNKIDVGISSFLIISHSMSAEMSHFLSQQLSSASCWVVGTEELTSLINKSNTLTGIAESACLFFEQLFSSSSSSN